MQEPKQNDTKKSPMQIIAYLVGIGIILFILFGIGFSLWGIINTM
jgi:hypothetical protein